MSNIHTPTLFTRHNRPLHTLWLDCQTWFCARELGRLIGRYLDDHVVRKLDSDQQRTVRLLRYGQIQDTVMISESGAYTVLAHHHIPENRYLRRWLTHQVIAVMRDRYEDDSVQPSRSIICDAHGSLELLRWRDELWIRLDQLEDVKPSHLKTKSPHRWRTWMRGIFR